MSHTMPDHVSTAWNGMPHELWAMIGFLLSAQDLKTLTVTSRCTHAALTEPVFLSSWLLSNESYPLHAAVNIISHFESTARAQHLEHAELSRSPVQQTDSPSMPSVVGANASHLAGPEGQGQPRSAAPGSMHVMARLIPLITAANHNTGVGPSGTHIPPGISISTRHASSDRVDVNARTLQRCCPGSPCTALLVAACKGSLAATQALLAAGAHVDSGSARGRTPLMQASGDGFLPVVEALMEAGAAVNARYGCPVAMQGATALYMAARGGRLDVVRRLLAAGADPNLHTTPNGMTPLMMAAEYSHCAIAQALLAAGASVNAVNSQGKSALTLAAGAGDLSLVRLLLEAGAWVEKPPAAEPEHAAGGDGDGFFQLHHLQGAEETDTPLICAAAAGHLGIVEALLAAGATVDAHGDSNCTALAAAAAHGHTGSMQRLLAAGAQVDSRTELLETPLIFAARAGRDAAVEVLLEAAADVHACSYMGCTPLLEAAAEGHVTVLQRLLAAGADVQASDGSGRTALMHAVRDGHYGAAQCLIGAGADIHARDQMGNNVLCHAAYGGNVALVNCIIQAGADVNAANHVTGKTPLMAACSGGFAEPVQALLAAGANVHAARWDDGFTPLHFAIMHGGCAATIKSLISAGADVSTILFDDGFTPLTWTCMMGRLEVARALLAAGVDVNERDPHGRLPLAYALAAGYGLVAEALLDAGAGAGLAGIEAADVDEVLAEAGRLGNEVDGQRDIERRLYEAAGRTWPPPPSAPAAQQAGPVMGPA